MGEVSSRAEPLAGHSSKPFVVLDENRFAYTAVKRLSAGRFRSVSPLVYLYGRSGVGKSHLAHRFLRTVQRQFPSTRIALLTVDDLETEPPHLGMVKTDSPRRGTSAHSDILVFDDLGELEERSDLQRRLIVLLDAVLQSDGRCLLTSQKPPGQLGSLLPRLINRCRAGVCAPIRFPATASRSVLIEHFAQRRQIPLSSETIQHLANTLPVSPRELQSALIRLENQARTERRPIDVALARRVVKLNPLPDIVTLPQIARAVSRHFGIPLSELRAARRQRARVVPRQCAMLLARELTSQTLGEIACYFGRINHKSVLYACRRLTERLDDDPELRRHLAEIRRPLNPTDADSC